MAASKRWPKPEPREWPTIYVGIEDEDLAQLIIDVRKRNEARLRLSKMTDAQMTKFTEPVAQRSRKSKAKPKSNEAPPE